MLDCVLLYCIVVCWIGLYCIVQRIAIYRTVSYVILHCVVLPVIILDCMYVYYMVLIWLVLYCVVVDCVASHGTDLYCVGLVCIVS